MVLSLVLRLRWRRDDALQKKDGLRFEAEARLTLVDERRAREKEQHQQAKDRPKQRGEERARREAERAARDA